MKVCTNCHHTHGIADCRLCKREMEIMYRALGGVDHGIARRQRCAKLWVLEGGDDNGGHEARTVEEIARAIAGT